MAYHSVGLDRLASFTTVREYRVTAGSVDDLESSIRASLRRAKFTVEIASSHVNEREPEASLRWILGRRDFRDSSTAGQNWRANWAFISGWSTYFILFGLVALVSVVGYFSRWPSDVIFWTCAIILVAGGGPILVGVFKAQPRSEIVNIGIAIPVDPPVIASSQTGVKSIGLLIGYGIADRTQSSKDVESQIIRPEPSEGNYVGYGVIIDDLGVKFKVDSL
jgi:hypothetical protein